MTNRVAPLQSSFGKYTKYPTIPWMASAATTAVAPIHAHRGRIDASPMAARRLSGGRQTTRYRALRIGVMKEMPSARTMGVTSQATTSPYRHASTEALADAHVFPIGGAAATHESA